MEVRKCTFATQLTHLLSFARDEQYVEEEEEETKLAGPGWE